MSPSTLPPKPYPPAEDGAVWRGAAFLAAVCDQLGRSQQLGSTAHTVAALPVPALADVALVVLPSAHDASARWWRVAGPSADLSTDGFAQALPDGLVAGARGAGVRPLPTGRRSRGDLLPHDGCAVVVPLPVGQLAGAALVLCRRPDRADFDPVEAATLHGYAVRAGAALTIAVLYAEQARTTTALRSALRPPPLPTMPGVALGAAYRPAHQALRLGGDFYEVRQLGDGGLLYAVGDVSGSGVGAAIASGRMRQSLQALCRLVTDPLRLLTIVNDVVYAGGDDDDLNQVATLVVGTAHAGRGGGLALRLAAGGHVPPLVVRAGGRVELLPLGGMLVGAVRDAAFVQTAVELAVGDTCVLYTDGVTQACSPAGEQFGTARLASVLADAPGLPPDDLAAVVEERVVGWLDGNHHDDMAVLAVRATGQPTAGAIR